MQAREERPVQQESMNAVDLSKKLHCSRKSKSITCV